MVRWRRQSRSGAETGTPYSGDVFGTVLTAELVSPTIDTRPSVDVPVEATVNGSVEAPAAGQPVVYETTGRPGDELTIDHNPPTIRVDRRPPPDEAAPVAAPSPAIDLHATATDFWSRYDGARAAADLFAVPPAATVAVVGALPVAAAVADRVRAQLWNPAVGVALLTDRADGACGLDGGPAERWTILRRPDDLVEALTADDGDAPLLVIDVPGELPSWMADLVDRLRQAGLGLVHYVLGGDPTDEDLATWHGELGRPSVLDLAAPVEPERIRALLDRGEPIASIAGVELSAELLLALDIETNHGL